jgi:hypothetical protein
MESHPTDSVACWQKELVSPELNLQHQFGLFWESLPSHCYGQVFLYAKEKKANIYSLNKNKQHEFIQPF